MISDHWSVHRILGSVDIYLGEWIFEGFFVLTRRIRCAMPPHCKSNPTPSGRKRSVKPPSMMNVNRAYRGTVGWTMSERVDANLARNPLRVAIWKRIPAYATRPQQIGVELEDPLVCRGGSKGC